MYGYEPPRWPDPAFPQQIHLDVLGADLAAAEQLATDAGATRLRDGGGHRVYADPVGHPFCLYEDAAAMDGRTEPGRIGRIVFDCFSPRSLAAFYAELMDMPVRMEDTVERVVLARAAGVYPMLAFQHAVGPMPQWPDPTRPEQVHLDLGFPDESARDLALSLGGICLRAGDSHHVIADPAGHPFCI
jgi:hypothetical protein